jgi:glycosyltransferase involved in cell wall biosynthesis
MSSQTRVLHVVDSLDPGGMERVAVNLANVMPRDRFACGLCATRRGGALASLVAADVERVDLNRTRRLDLGAIRRLAAYVRSARIEILHAHGTSLFTAAAASCFPPHPAVVWHDHYGLYPAPRPTRAYRLAALRVSAVVAVTEELADWARRALGVRNDRVWYVPNFTTTPPAAPGAPDLPGRPGRRIVCVANLRPQKAHLDLVRAFRTVRDRVPDAHLLLAGTGSDDAYVQTIQRAVVDQGLTNSVTFLGHRADIAAVLRACDIGVLSSSGEGFPLALVEYGMAGLAVVATAVGQCAEVLDGGRAGRLTAPGDPGQLAEALIELLQSSDRRDDLGRRLRDRVEQRYSQHAVVQQIGMVYDTVTRRTSSAVASAVSAVRLGS